MHISTATKIIPIVGVRADPKNKIHLHIGEENPGGLNAVLCDQGPVLVSKLHGSSLNAHDLETLIIARDKSICARCAFIVR